MLINICPCRRCDGEESTAVGYEELYCMQCGQPLTAGDEVYTGAEGMLHEDCLTEYAFTDVTRGELLDFAETQAPQFMRYVLDLRNLRKGGESW